MSDGTFFIDRSVLLPMLNGNERAARQFEDMQRRVSNTEESAGATSDTAKSVSEAEALLLSAGGIAGGRVLAFGVGFTLDTDTGGQANLTADFARSAEGDSVTFLTQGNTVLTLPPSGIVATRMATETLSNKTMDNMRLTGLVDALDDTAAAAAGVEINEPYRNGSQLMVRVV